MMGFDPGKLAKGLQNAEKLGGAAEAAKGLLNGVKDAASGNAPEQMVEALRKLIAEAKRLLEASGGNNKELADGIDKAMCSPSWAVMMYCMIFAPFRKLYLKFNTNRTNSQCFFQ